MLKTFCENNIVPNRLTKQCYIYLHVCVTTDFQVY